MKYLIVFLVLPFSCLAANDVSFAPDMSPGYTIAAYYFPNYHPDPRNDKWHGPGWTEWELVKRATPRFDGHQQPKAPLWGYTDESNPDAMAQKIAAAADHGIDAFIFDWYWYEDGPYLQGGLEDGFLKAPNNGRMKFAVMWANHDWQDIQPAQRSRPAKTLAKGGMDVTTFRAATDHMIETYFRHPSYWRVNGGLYVSVYELMTLVSGLGGIEQTRAELNGFRERVRKAGLGELHLNAVAWGVKILPGEKTIKDPQEMLAVLGFDSVTSYVWLHHQPLPTFPRTPYADVRDASVKDAEKFIGMYKVPYYPNVTMGWDPSPRTIQSDVYENLGYPFTPILEGNTPEAYRQALSDFKTLIDRTPKHPKIVTLNAWNEWTEGSYLEPDTIHGLAYLEAIRSVFGK
jgi:hypothetical protein